MTLPTGNIQKNISDFNSEDIKHKMEHSSSKLNLTASHEASFPIVTSRRYIHRGPPINILLVGETGTGKSTMINAFANYLVSDTLQGAMNGELRVLVPCAFNITQGESNETKQIMIGQANTNEHCEEIGQSSTQLCRTYTFRLGNRNLHLIDAPGIGDVRGLEQDRFNCDHILSYVNQYEHLNGICIFFKSNCDRLTINFRFCIKEILAHLNLSAKDNLMFIFTNSRGEFYTPGRTAPILREVLKEIDMQLHIQIPFNTTNTFSFDNEAFRFLALHENGITFTGEELESYSRSWDKSVEESYRLIERILQCDLHAVQDSVSINSARQLIRMLARPIGEIARLIQENLQLAEKYKQNILKNPNSSIPNRIPQKTGEFRPIPYPRTVCTAPECVEKIMVGDEPKINYKTHCHQRCYLPDVERECVAHPILKHCSAMNKTIGRCKVCRCNWNSHMHILYEYETSITYVGIDNSNSSMALKSIDKRITQLRQEEDAIIGVCRELSKFIRQNAILPYNEDILEYVKYFIHEEKLKGSMNSQTVIKGLEKFIEDCEAERKLILETATRDSGNSRSASPTSDPMNAYAIVSRLYQLPQFGRMIRKHVDTLKREQSIKTDLSKHVIQVPLNSRMSNMMQHLINLTT